MVLLCDRLHELLFAKVLRDGAADCVAQVENIEWKIDRAAQCQGPNTDERWSITGQGMHYCSAGRFFWNLDCIDSMHTNVQR